MMLAALSFLFAFGAGADGCPPDTTETSFAAVLDAPSLLADYPLTPVAGTATMLGAAQALYRLEDRYIPVRFSPERRFFSKSAGLLYRFARLTLLDLPVDVLHHVVRHEFFGHGGRGRLVGGDAVRYTISLPPPYGPGRGSASFDFDEEELTWPEFGAYVAGGLETTLIGLASLEDRWAVRGTMDFREALHYVLGIMSYTGYINSAEGNFRAAGHDVEAYLYSLAREQEDGYAHASNAQSLGLWSLVEFTNFPFYVAAAHVLWDFLVQGRAHVQAFRIPISNTYVTPQAHLRLAPYGPEVDVRVLVSRPDRLVSGSLRRGTSTGSVSVAGRADDVFRRATWSLDARLALWRQPRMRLTPGESSGGSHDLGILGAATIRRSMGLPFFLLGEIGVKSRGYVPGERLSAGPLFRLGIVWRD